MKDKKIYPGRILKLTNNIKRTECAKPILFYPKKNIANDIHKYCMGNKTNIINQLLRLGIDRLVELHKKEGTDHFKGI